MIPELGNFALALSVAISLILSIVPLIGVSTANLRLMQTARPLSALLFMMMLLAFICLIHALINNDFSVSYVASHSNSELPVYYRIAAAWGAHEGSLLLWAVLLSGWTFSIAIFSRQLPIEAVARVLAIMAMIVIGFVLFILFTSNPFTRTLPNFAVDGNDLNPLLQDVGLIFHPPLLYMGYVGFSVAFAFSIAALLSGRLDTAWARWSRPWSLAAWIFLTLGIILGSFWAYYELGWGGWWFWDPVENASLMPWLTGTALIHSLAATEKRAVFKSWTILLALSTFSLCLLGAFLVRSGIMVSVHAFASDPSRGILILLYLLFIVGGSLLLYAIKAPQLHKSRTQYEYLSREVGLLGNNILLVTATIVVLLGTILPLVHRLLGQGSISIGAPFFNTMFVWLIVPFSIILGIIPLILWRRDNFSRIKTDLIIAASLSAIFAITVTWLLIGSLVVLSVLGLALAYWIIILSLLEAYRRATYHSRFWQGVKLLSPSYWGMTVAHIGVAITMIGISISEGYSIEKDVRMVIGGEATTLNHYSFTLDKMDVHKGANYSSDVGLVTISVQGKKVAALYPEKRYYNNSYSVMTESAIDAGISRDLYVALGEPLSDNAWAMRIYYKPFMRWIWFGGLFMALGGLLSVLDKRYRVYQPKTQSE